MVNYLKKEAWRHSEKLLAFFACAIIAIGIIYLYFVSSIVLEAANRSHNLQVLQFLKRDYQILETDYLNSLSEFNLEYAYSLGFVGGNVLSFVSRQASVAQNVDYGKAIR